MPFGECPEGLARFTGQWQEPAAGLYLLGTGRRAGVPALMRFASPDAFSPFAEGGLNAYAYCAAEPVNRVDPEGASWGTWLNGLVDALTPKLAIKGKVHHQFLDTPLGSFKGLGVSADLSIMTNGRSAQGVINSVTLGKPHIPEGRQWLNYNANAQALPNLVSTGVVCDLSASTHGRHAAAVAHSIPLGEGTARVLGTEVKFEARLGTGAMADVAGYALIGVAGAVAAAAGGARGWRLIRQTLRHARR
ncbi:RHS repeat-associated core domain-containing protein [Pseudomonas typographi]